MTVTWLNNFKEYAHSFLKVKNKAGEIVPFRLNAAQEYIHTQLEKQKKETGMVRAEILKGRQQGCSTYVEGRFFHKTTTNFGIQSLILTHEQAATDNLFGMTQRYYENLPDALKPALSASNAKELSFSKLDSSFKVATAGNKGAGRSVTAQLLHGSEVAYWPSAEEHLAGIMQTIPLEHGTEIIFESTANGIGNVFHSIWNSKDWLQIFVPWYWQSEYRCSNVDLNDEDFEYGELFDLDREQMQWRRRKIGELGNDVKLFMREYPSSPAEAFSVSDERSLISSVFVQKARKAAAEYDRSAPKIIGVDPARFGDDSTVIYIRQGRIAERIAKIRGKDTMEVVGIIINAINRYTPDAVYVDVGGIGAGIYDRLKEMNYRIVRDVNFGSEPLDKKKYINKRAEMWGIMNEWLSNPPAQIPDDDDIEIDLCGLRYSYDSHGRMKIESKEDAKKRGIKSPDEGDALALTFAFPVRPKHIESSRIITFNTTVSGMGG